MKYPRNFLCILLVSLYGTVALSQPILVIECPDTSESDLVVLPDPYDCSRFYMCGPNGQPMHMICPDGLYFNPKLDVCDFPGNVECNPIPTETISTTKTTTTPHYNMTTTYSPNYNKTTVTFPQHNLTTEGHQNITTTGPQYNVTVISTSSPAINSSTDQLFNATNNSTSQIVYVKTHGISFPECPISGSDLVIIPDPHDCGSYYMCTVVGLPIHMNCPAGLYFNPLLQVCDYPQNVDCISDNFTTSQSPSQNVTTPEYSTYQPSNITTTWSPVNASIFAPISNTSTPAPEITTVLPFSNITTSANSENNTITISPIINSTV